MVGRWHPQYIVRQVGEPRQSSTEIVIVETDLGQQGFLKAIGNPAGTHCLASELVGTQLAEWLGLATLDYGLIQVDESLDSIRLYSGGKARTGPAFISRSEPGDTWDGSKSQLRKLVNPDEISRLVVFDTWVMNRDRKSKRMAVWDNVFLSTRTADKGKLRLIAIDHTHCFAAADSKPELDLRQIEVPGDLSVYGLFPEFRGFLDRAVIRQAARRLGTLERATVEAILGSIPEAWRVGKVIRQRWAEQILARAAWTADQIETLALGDKHVQTGWNFGGEENES